LGDPEQLAALKQQLKQVLADVEKQEQAVTESLRPQTVAEADELQQKLQGALEELKGLRAELARKEKEGKQSGN
jgi:DNA repair exonuclease SbcCD ATPase subunit